MSQHIIKYLVRERPPCCLGDVKYSPPFPARTRRCGCRRVSTPTQSIAPGYTVIFRQPLSRLFVEDTSFPTAVQFSAVGNMFFRFGDCQKLLMLMMRVRAQP